MVELSSESAKAKTFGFTFLLLFCEESGWSIISYLTVELLLITKLSLDFNFSPAKHSYVACFINIDEFRKCQTIIMYVWFTDFYSFASENVADLPNPEPLHNEPQILHRSQQKYLFVSFSGANKSVQICLELSFKNIFKFTFLPFDITFSLFLPFFFFLSLFTVFNSLAQKYLIPPDVENQNPFNKKVQLVKYSYYL